MNEQVDLSNCDREPIHQLGQIQDFGALVAVNGDWLVSQRSANLEAIIGLDKPIKLGTRLAPYLNAAAVNALRSAVSELAEDDQVERLFGVDLAGNGQLFDCAIHTSGPNQIIEIEPHVAGESDRQFARLRPVMSRLDKHDTVDALTEHAAHELRETLGFDRVMVYRFHDDLSGEVIAEARRDDLESFYQLRYPKSDIPAQARALYVRNRIRIISDVNGTAVPIEPGVSVEGEPLDLSMSTLRSVSPIHLEYLRNMGVEASLSISIIIGGKLWGLFACHHYAPRVLPYAQRTATELFSELFSLLLERSLSLENSKLREVGRTVHDRLMRDIVSGTALAESLPTLDPIIDQVIAHDGISVFVEGHYEARGKAPNEEEFRAILPALNGAATSRVLASTALPDRIPEAARFADRAVGALVIPISRTPRDHLVLWRRELKQTVTWAGNPQKAVDFGPNGARLTPRKSFEAWQESVDGTSKQWSPAELQIAESLRVTLLEIILRLTDEVVEERTKAQQQQELLIAELNHRVRNILNLIRGLINKSRSEASSVENFAEIVGGRINSLASAHDNITKGNWSPAPLRELFETEAEAYISEQRERMVITGPYVMISPEAYTVLALVIHEMMTNSAKYGSLSDQSGQLDVTIMRGSGDEMLLEWREIGGPPVKPPKRRGFGSTIIERSIPFELEGNASIDYKLKGVEAAFCIPSRFITWVSKEDAGANEREKKAVLMSELSNVPATVLLVEDSMIIALDTEDCLRELGVKTVQLESTVAGALDALGKDTPDLALLDYNLGKESSERVAEELKARGIPYWLATGYGEMEDRLEEMGARGLLTKPYGKDDLARILKAFGETS
ncbi:HWE histidine kinase domain-containing protein [Qipengyuania marisflavi]|uniref:histidine kinase n=1 Tax=Qipengyuania marisflavi TaxID=2486356 RepID=A0A5S3P018_9SPHN|nr:HWE histidine kinase domain-containing protein [Qipengyuania marisflavi]TMM46130.1 GAF domain-containing protein [Qipengyuania marisflavi]